jgi:broad specificity phosphatase PhoE
MTPAAVPAAGAAPPRRRQEIAVHRVYLIRHAETDWSRAGRHTGTTDLPLTDTGRQRARELERVLAQANFVLVLSSPLRRARQTTALAGFGERAVIDDDLVEWNYGEYEGLTTEQIHEKAPGWMVFKDGGPGGETPAQVGARVDRVIARIRAADGDVALFGHGHVLRVLAARWLGLPVSGGSQFLLDTGTLSVLSHYRGIPALEQWNSRVEEDEEANP